MQRRGSPAEVAFPEMVLFPQIFGPAGIFSGFFLAPDKLLYVLAFLVPLILLYLIRPKPTNVAVPSLMFILKDMGRSNVHRLFRTLFKDILFLIQLLAILLLAVSLAKPFINVSQDSLVEQSVVVIDDSASTRAQDGARFDAIRDLAKGSLASGNVLILAHESPQVLDSGGEQRLSASEAKGIIDDLDPSDIQGDLPSALDLAAQFVGPQSKVTIVGDFVLSGLENPDLIGAKIKVLRSKGALVEVKSVPVAGKNVGIVDARLNANNATLELKVQNFNDRPAEFGLDENGESAKLPQNVLAPKGQPGSLLSVSLPLGNGVTRVTLTPPDDFMADNDYYVSIPSQSRIAILVISNDGAVRQSRVIAALDAVGDKFTSVGIDYGVPPKVPDLQHNLYVVKDIDPQFILPGVVNGLKEQVEQGSVLVVFAQPSLFTVDFLGMLPVEPKTGADPLSGRTDIIVNDSLSLMHGLSDIGQVDGGQLLRVRAANGSIVYASVATNDGPEPVIAAKRLGKGAVIYYGIRDRPQADIDPQSYAVIWGRIADFTLVDPMSLNIATGSVINAPGGGKVKTPAGTRASPVLAARSGLYQTSAQTLAANLYPLSTSFGVSDTEQGARVESDIAAQANVTGDEGQVGAAGAQEVKVPKDLSLDLIVAGLAIMLFELFFIKFRGDL